VLKREGLQRYLEIRLDSNILCVLLVIDGIHPSRQVPVGIPIILHVLGV